MCRWLGYSGGPIRVERLLFEPEHSLIDQSLSARTGPSTTNGDGFGLGWYADREIPGVYRDVRPAWNDPNLREVAAQVTSHQFLAHVREHWEPVGESSAIVIEGGEVERFEFVPLEA